MDNGHKISALGSKFKFFTMDTPGQGVDNLGYMYYFLSALTQTLTLYQSTRDTNTRTMSQAKYFVLFQNSCVLTL